MIRQADKQLKDQWRDKFNLLPKDSRIALRQALSELRIDALRKSEYSWNKHKAPMALYWKCVGVYAGHIARTININ
ncbi:MAG: hypothetical protein GX640_24905 [Fibrobacter sp.]|nr:hypothetical protein [Fibrobacter sp.]